MYAMQTYFSWSLKNSSNNLLSFMTPINVPLIMKPLKMLYRCLCSLNVENRRTKTGIHILVVFGTQAFWPVTFVNGHPNWFLPGHVTFNHPDLKWLLLFKMATLSDFCRGMSRRKKLVPSLRHVIRHVCMWVGHVSSPLHLIILWFLSIQSP